MMRKFQQLQGQIFDIPVLFHGQHAGQSVRSRPGHGYLEIICRSAALMNASQICELPRRDE